MINYWQQLPDGKISKLKKEELDTTKRTWIDARVVTRDDVELLQSEFNIDPEHILDILDPDELSRIEDGDGYVLTITRLPIFDPTAETQYSTIPLGIIVKGITLADFPSFIIRIISRADITFLRYLKEINRRSIGIQSELRLSVENKEILQLLSLEKSLVYFTTSLKSNQLLLEKFRKTKLISLDTDDIDWLDDVEIDNKQAIEMAETYRNVIFGVMDAFASIISNNLNIVMKKLAVLNLIMMVPTFITSFFGMNMPLPFIKYGNIAVWIVSLICLISIFITNMLLNFSQRPTGLNKKPKNKKRNKSEEAKQKKMLRRLKSIENALQD